MTSNIVFANNLLAKKALTITTDITFTSTGDLIANQNTNLFYLKSKNRHFNFIPTFSNSTPKEIIYYVGSTGITINYFIITNARALIDKATSVIFEVLGSNDGSTYTSIISLTINSSTAFTGHRNNDYLLSFSNVTYKYFKIKLTASGFASTGIIPLTSFYAGSFFDIGEDPQEFNFDFDEKNYNFKTDSGNSFFKHDITRNHIYDFVYQAITENNLNDFINNIYIDSQRYGTYIKNSNLNMVNNNTLIHGEILDLTYKKIVTDYYQVKFKFKEL